MVREMVQSCWTMFSAQELKLGLLTVPANLLDHTTAVMLKMWVLFVNLVCQFALIAAELPLPKLFQTHAILSTAPPPILCLSGHQAGMHVMICGTLDLVAIVIKLWN